MLLRLQRGILKTLCINGVFWNSSKFALGFHRFTKKKDAICWLDIHLARNTYGAWDGIKVLPYTIPAGERVIYGIRNSMRVVVSQKLINPR